MYDNNGFNNGFGGNGFDPSGYGYAGWGVPNAYGQPTNAGNNMQFNRYAQNNPQQTNNTNNRKSPTQFAWVNGEVGAQAFLLNPNSSVLLMDSDNPVFYIKTSDMSGKASIKAYKYEELTQAQEQSSDDKFVTKKEFEDFKKSFLGALNKENKENE